MDRLSSAIVALLWMSAVSPAAFAAPAPQNWPGVTEALERIEQSNQQRRQYELQVQEQRRLDAEQAQQSRLQEEQIRALRLENDRRSMQTIQPASPSTAGPTTSVAQSGASEINRFMEAIKYRRYRWADFDKVVFAEDLPLTTEMIGFLAECNLAADVAYYLGTHKSESAAIARMPVAEAGRAIFELEAAIRRQYAFTGMEPGQH